LRAGGLELRLDLRVPLLLLVRLGLRVRARLLELLDPDARIRKRLRHLVDARRRLVDLLLKTRNLLVPSDDADLGVVVPIDAQPMAAEPRAVRRDHRLAVRQLVPQPHRFLEGRGHADADKERQGRRRTADQVRQPTDFGRPGSRGRVGLLGQRQAAFGELGKALCDVIERRDADGLQIPSEHRLDRTLPAGLDGEPFRKRTTVGDRCPLEPLAELLGGSPERRFLQRLERGQPASIVLQLLAQAIEIRGDLLLVLALLLNLLPDGLEGTGRFGTRALQRFLFDREGSEPLLELIEAERFALRALTLLLLRQAVALRRELLEARLLDLGGTFGVRDVASNLLPTLAPCLHRGLGLLKRRLGLVSCRVRLFETGAEFL